MSKRNFIGAVMLIATLVMTGCGNKNNNKQETKNEESATTTAKRMMIIVDPQIDFISGSLAVEGGQDAIENLIKAFDNGLANDYDRIVITLDAHPANHCSFVEQGGVFPAHCVIATEGQITYPALKQKLAEQEKLNISGNWKGEKEDKEEFSIFQSETQGPLLKEEIENGNYLGIDICGIASDYCVYETLKDLLAFYPAEKVRVAMNCVAAVADNEKLPAFMQEKGVEAIEF